MGLKLTFRPTWPGPSPERWLQALDEEMERFRAADDVKVRASAFRRVWAAALGHMRALAAYGREIDALVTAQI